MTTVLEDIGQLQEVFDDIARSFVDGEYVDRMEELSTDLEEHHRYFFEREAGPSGAAWPELAPRTVKKKGFDDILYETGWLKQSLAGRTSDSIRDVLGWYGRTILEFGTTTEYAHIHQDGFGIIPQREHVGINDEILDPFIEDIADLTVQHLME